MHTNPDQLFISELTLESMDNHSRNIITERTGSGSARYNSKMVNKLDLCNSILTLLFRK